jgi:Kef-type K+ transport system membrane component KefB
MRIIKQDIKRLGAALKILKQSAQLKPISVSTDTKDTLVALGTMALFPLLGMTFALTFFKGMFWSVLYGATLSIAIVLVIVYFEWVYYRAKGRW